MKNELLRNLPKMDLLINDKEVKNLVDILGRERVINELRETLDFYRKAILSEKKKFTSNYRRNKRKCRK